MKLKQINRIHITCSALLFNVFIVFSLYNSSINNRALIAVLTNDTNLNYEFNKIKTYIDVNTKKLKIYIANFQSDANMATIEGSFKDQYGHGQTMMIDKNLSMISTYSTDTSIDTILYDRIRRDESLLVKTVNESNVVYLPIMLGSLFRPPIETFHNLCRNMSIWLDDNQEILKGKLILFIFSHVEEILNNPFYNETKVLMSKYQKSLYVYTIEESPKRTFNYTYFIIPYPSMTKFQLRHNQTEYKYEVNENRLVDVFFSGNSRKQNAYRQFIFDNIEIKTNMPYENFKDSTQFKNRKTGVPLSVIYHLGFNDHVVWMANQSWNDKLKNMLGTIEWKRNSKLCLEPYGDTPTRRSFWDSIMLGCIPVIFTRFKLPFEDLIDYDRFVVRIDIPPEKLLNGTDYNSLFQIYLSNEIWIRAARRYIKHIRQFLQYPWVYDYDYQMVNSTYKYDAFGVMLAKLADYLPKN